MKAVKYTLNRYVIENDLEPYYYSFGGVTQATCVKLDRFVKIDENLFVGFGTTRKEAKERLLESIRNRVEKHMSNAVPETWDFVLKQ